MKHNLSFLTPYEESIYFTSPGCKVNFTLRILINTILSMESIFSIIVMINAFYLVIISTYIHISISMEIRYSVQIKAFRRILTINCDGNVLFIILSLRKHYHPTCDSTLCCAIQICFC